MSNALQKPVFEHKGYSRFRNWQAICQLEDWCLKMAITRANLDSDEGHRLQTAFPECFSYDEDRGKIPVSILREYSNNSRENLSDPSKFLVATGTLDHFQVPYLSLVVDPEPDDLEPGEIAITSEYFIAMGFEPKTLLTDFRGEDFGKVVCFRGDNYFVAETSGMFRIFLVPAEVLAMNQ